MHCSASASMHSPTPRRRPQTGSSSCTRTRTRTALVLLDCSPLPPPLPLARARRPLHCSSARRSAPPPPLPPPHPVHVDAAGAEVLQLLRAHFDVDGGHMRMVAMYGSAAFTQISADAKEEGGKQQAATPAPAQHTPSPPTQPPAAAPMLDLIFAVDDPLAFHLANMSRNPSHYSFLRHFRWWPSLLQAVQEYGAGVWYNTLIPLPVPGTDRTRLIKYGVISTKRLEDDLTNWESLYIAGRMHKPMHMLLCSPSLQSASELNLRSALTTALLLIDASRADVVAPPPPPVDAPVGALLDADTPTRSSKATPPTTAATTAPTPPTPAPVPAVAAASSSLVTLRSLFGTIASLSYFGDIRMGLAEHPDKVANIVGGSWAELAQLYKQPMRERLGEQVNKARKQQDTLHLLASLPSNFQSQLLRRLDADPSGSRSPAPSTPAASVSRPAAGTPWHGLALRPPAARHAMLSAALGSIVSQSSKQQTIKGLATAGVRKSLQYGLAKVRKALRK